MSMTAREIIKARLNHEGTDVTPYTVHCEPQLHKKLAEYYKDEDWDKKRLRQFMCSHLYVDTILLEK